MGKSRLRRDLEWMWSISPKEGRKFLGLLIFDVVITYAMY